MNGTYGIQTRGDPPLRFGARGDPPVVNSLRDDSFEVKLIPNRITGRNNLNGRGMDNCDLGFVIYDLRFVNRMKGAAEAHGVRLISSIRSANGQLMI